VIGRFNVLRLALPIVEAVVDKFIGAWFESARIGRKRLRERRITELFIRPRELKFIYGDTSTEAHFSHLK